MSVAHLSIRELSTFVAIASARCQAGTLAEIAEVAAMMSRSNAAAFTGQYGDIAISAEADELEAEAIRLLANDDLSAHFGPLLYNCATNGGTFYYGDLPADPTQMEIQSEVAHWRRLEDAAQKWQDGHRRQLARAEENAVAFDDVGRLPMKTAAELKAIMGDGALIIATFRVNESDSMTDYYGGRTSRTVIIGSRKSKRESFQSLRKAAAAFPPTADYGPGKDIFTARVVLTNNVKSNGAHYGQGQQSHWHQEIGHGRKFTTQVEAQQFIDGAGKPFDLNMGDGQTANFEWQIGHESLEHRENYSMGGGNYLGRGRYDGWIVKSTSYVSEAMEFWTPANR